MNFIMVWIKPIKLFGTTKAMHSDEWEWFVHWLEWHEQKHTRFWKKNTQTRTKERDKNELSKHNKKSLLTCLSASKLFRFHLSNCMTFFSFLALPFTQIKSIDSRKWTRKQYRLTKKKTCEQKLLGKYFMYNFTLFF